MRRKAEVHIFWEEKIKRWKYTILVGGGMESICPEEFDSTEAALQAATALLHPKYEPSPVELYGIGQFTVALEWDSDADAWRWRVLAYEQKHLVSTATYRTNAEALWDCKRMLEAGGLTINKIEIRNSPWKETL